MGQEFKTALLSLISSNTIFQLWTSYLERDK